MIHRNRTRGTLGLASGGDGDKRGVAVWCRKGVTASLSVTIAGSGKRIGIASGTSTGKSTEGYWLIGISWVRVGAARYR